jgi:hypothetical protein
MYRKGLILDVSEKKHDYKIEQREEQIDQRKQQKNQFKKYSKPTTSANTAKGMLKKLAAALKKFGVVRKEDDLNDLAKVDIVNNGTRINDARINISFHQHSKAKGFTRRLRENCGLKAEQNPNNVTDLALPIPACKELINRSTTQEIEKGKCKKLVDVLTKLGIIDDENLEKVAMVNNGTNIEGARIKISFYNPNKIKDFNQKLEQKFNFQAKRSSAKVTDLTLTIPECKKLIKEGNQKIENASIEHHEEIRMHM